MASHSWGNSWDYNEGASEIRMGNALRDGYRDKVFLMTRIDGRSRREARKRSTNRYGDRKPIASISFSITKYSASMIPIGSAMKKAPV